jgi:hypothetical protein
MSRSLSINVISIAYKADSRGECITKLSESSDVTQKMGLKFCSKDRALIVL